MTAGLLAPPASLSRLKSADASELSAIAERIRKDIVRVTMARGGHLATNLGCVELTIALHRTLDSPRDKLIWDTGNQCYPHKILTDRSEAFETLRSSNGISGFVNRSESPHDPFTSGHAGTALSAALGIAIARDRLGETYRVTAVVGDGGLSSGLCFEALNHLGVFRGQLLLVVNDNMYSIGPTRGAMAARLRHAHDRILDGTFFEDLGLNYLGPIDGHDLPLLMEVLNEAVQMPTPVVLHVLTQKGKGYAPAEADPERFHSVSPPTSAEAPDDDAGTQTFSETFGRAMVELAETDDRLIAVTAAMTHGTGLAAFAETYPDRILDVGIAEQHAVTVAAGLAAGGCRPVVALYSTFLQRGYDQLIHDVCLQNLPVTFVIDRAGLVGADGATHHGVFDLGFLRVVPNLTVLSPASQQDFVEALRVAVQHSGPVALRIPRGSGPSRLGHDSTPIRLTEPCGMVLRDGQDVALIAIGNMTGRALEAAAVLERHGVQSRVIDARFVKPLDTNLLVETARRVRQLFTLEEHALHGGFGTAVLEVLAQHRIATPVDCLGIADAVVEHGSVRDLRVRCGVTTEHIVDRVLAAMAPTPDVATDSVTHVDTETARRLMDDIARIELPAGLSEWIDRYRQVGERNDFLWNWCWEALRLSTLPCIEPSHAEANGYTKLLGVMFVVLLDDVADRSASLGLLEQLLKIPYEGVPVRCDDGEPEEAYVSAARAVWTEIMHRARRLPRFAEFRELLDYDIRQLLNSMRYSHLVNRMPEIVNLAEHELYLPHNMHMMISGTLDLMASPQFDRSELGKIREAVWNAQCMGRIGNWITTWERELGDRDFTSGVFAFAVREGLVTSRELPRAEKTSVRQAVQQCDYEGFFLKRWRNHRGRLLALAESVRSVDLRKLVEGLERLIQLHLASRGFK